MGDDTDTIIPSNGNGVHHHHHSIAKIEKVNTNGVYKHQQNGNNNHVKENVPVVQQQFQPPDGGIRAWTILISAFLCNGIIFGIINTYGVIYMQLQEQLKMSGDEEASSKAGTCRTHTPFLSHRGH